MFFFCGAVLVGPPLPALLVVDQLYLQQQQYSKLLHDRALLLLLIDTHWQRTYKQFACATLLLSVRTNRSSSIAVWCSSRRHDGVQLVAASAGTRDPAADAGAVHTLLYVHQ